MKVALVAAIGPYTTKRRNIVRLTWPIRQVSSRLAGVGSGGFNPSRPRGLAHDPSRRLVRRIA